MIKPSILAKEDKVVDAPVRTYKHQEKNNYDVLKLSTIGKERIKDGGTHQKKVLSKVKIVDASACGWFLR